MELFLILCFCGASVFVFIGFMWVKIFRVTGYAFDAFTALAALAFAGLSAAAPWAAGIL